MRKIIACVILLAVQFVSSQELKSENDKTITYKYGHNGMELIVTSSKETIIVSTFNSKLELKEDIAKRVYNYYKINKDNNCFTPDEVVIIDGNNARVTGKCLITKKGRLTAVEFYYEKIEWNSGITELFCKKLG
ncbi:hypothetical protein OX283_012280 [Flavobacterium sp. SUN052]|uniref:hypothetical protein n=1 Tax=Flavobacterium sp. SUN052 TaxID=3002441 RepID=UPI00237E0287|nr:hypothetical protein [Flavobacterium sp. SUN052]MEC4005438.1 hypothetical protein [Flavobacterium sp. SUN052]